RGDQGTNRHSDVAAGARPAAADAANRRGRGKSRVMTTSTTDPRLLVHAYVDGELDPANALELERQLANDPALAAERERIAALRRTIAERLPREPAPAGLARRIEAAVGARSAPARITSHPSWRALAASVAVAAFLGSGATWLALAPAPAPADADLVVANHVR